MAVILVTNLNICLLQFFFTEMVVSSGTDYLGCYFDFGQLFLLLTRV